MRKLIKNILLISTLLLSYQAQSRERPNFVIIFVDDMGYGDASCYGHPTILTPNLDQMAAEGMKMTQFYCASPVCSPSRAALLTGRLPIRTGINGVLFPRSENGLPHSEKTIAKLLKDEGYATACIGKWHLGHKPEYLPTTHGFEYYFGIPYSNDMYIDSMAPLAENILLREGVSVAGIRNNAYFKHNPKYVPLMRQEEVIEFPADQSTLTKRYTEEAINYIRNNKDHPFFLYLAHTMPHTPLYASEDFEGTSMRGLYGDVIGEIDWSVGKVLNELRDQGLHENTLVVFTSDNGPWLIQKGNGGSAGPLRAGKMTTWDGGMREPGIFWWPGEIDAGQLNSELASTLDLLPTIADFAGVDVPSDRTYDGYSLKAMLTGRGMSPRETMFFYKGKNLQAIRKGSWKIHYRITNDYGKEAVDLDVPELYNLDHDPEERYNIAKGNEDIIREFNELNLAHEKSLEPDSFTGK